MMSDQLTGRKWELVLLIVGCRYCAEYVSSKLVRFDRSVRSRMTIQDTLGGSALYWNLNLMKKFLNVTD